MPASDGEIAAALRLNRVVVLEDQSIRFIAHRYRLKCLSPLLRSLISTKAKAKGKEKEEKKSIVASIKLDDMMETMDAVDCSEEIARRIVEWYGEPSESDPTRWIMSIEDLVREIGICVLVEGGVCSAMFPSPSLIHMSYAWLLIILPADQSIRSSL